MFIEKSLPTRRYIPKNTIKIGRVIFLNFRNTADSRRDAPLFTRCCRGSLQFIVFALPGFLRAEATLYLLYVSSSPATSTHSTSYTSSLYYPLPYTSLHISLSLILHIISPFSLKQTLSSHSLIIVVLAL